MATKVQLCCMTVDCEIEAVKYCTNCAQLFCAQHDRVHEEGFKILLNPHAVLTIDEYIARKETSSPFCNQHNTTPLITACIQCYTPMCAKCLDDLTAQPSVNCQPSGKDKHAVCSIGHVSQKIQDELQQLLSEVRVKELRHGDELKKNQQFYDKQMERNRDDLEKLSAKIEELHTMIDEFATKTRETIFTHMKWNKEIMQELEADYSVYQKSCQQVQEKTTLSLRFKDEVIVKERQKFQVNIEELMEFEFNGNLGLSEMYLEIDADEQISLPIHLHVGNPQLSDQVTLPKRLKLKRTQKTANGYSVFYISDGQMVYGDQSGVHGLGVNHEFDGGRPDSFYEHCGSLYMLTTSRDDQRYQVHIFNLKDRTFQKSVIVFKYKNLQQIVVNHDHIIITNCSSKSVKVYSTKNFRHLFDINNHLFNQYPWGLALFKGTIVVGDRKANIVSNITVSPTPEVRWMTTDIVNPCAVRACSRFILVGTNVGPIHALSFEGELLSVIKAPECGTEICDIAVFDNQLALCNASSCTIKVYDIESDESG